VNPRRCSAICLVLAAMGLAALAQGPTPPVPAPPAAPALEETAVVPVRQSEPAVGQPPQEADAQAEPSAPAIKGRDPFWPVGYVPRRPERRAVGKTIQVAQESGPELQSPDWDGARKRMDIRGTSRMGRDKDSQQDRYLAVVNGKVVEPGDVVTVTFDGRVYRWRIQSIGPQGITLSRLDCRPQ
jgi:hypothetical protein